MSHTRITYVITDLRTGGVPLHLLRLATAVRERGYLPGVVSLAPPGAVSQRLQQRGIATEHCNASSVTDLTLFVRLAYHLRRATPDLIHSFLFHANVACRVAVPLAGCSLRRLVCELQTVEIERPWHLTVEGALHRLGGLVVGNSPSVVEHLRRQAHIAPARLRCIAGGVDVRSLRNARKVDRSTLNLPQNAAVVLWVGRLDKVKGLDELIAAFARVVRGIDARLLLVGSGGYAEQVRRQITRHGVGGQVHLLGERSDVAGLLKLADLFAFPSYTEGMPNALLEAMAAGKPIVTTDVAGCRDLIDHEKTGLMVPPHDADALAAAMTRLLQNRSLADQLACHAAHRAETHYAFARCVDRYQTLYGELLDRVPGR